MASKDKPFEEIDGGATSSLLWLLAAVMGVSVGLPVAAGAFLRYMG
jgi:hypothetical protein